MDTTYSEWIEQSRAGDQTAFGRIVRKYQGIVSGVVYGILGDFHKSEDIAQETFLIAWKKLDELRDGEKLPGWLCGIARNLAYQARLKEQKIPTVSAAKADDVVETSVDPARILAQSEQNRLIWNALEKIPEKYRVPLVCFYRNEKSVPEIAQSLEITENALHVRLNRARKFLRKELEKQVEGAILSSGPGEFFSLAVLAALPTLAIVSTSGSATAAATAVTAETALAASVMVAAPNVGQSNTTLFGASSWWGGSWWGSSWWSTIQPFLTVFLMLFSWFFWILGVVPGIWVSIKNAPTLRARRYLILCSLRLYGLFGALVFFLAACFTLHRMIREIGLAPVLFGEYNSPLEPAMYFLVFTAGLGVICGAAVYLLIVSPITYRRIVREDTGLIVAKSMVPLEESFLSQKRLNRTFFRIGTFLLAVYVCGVICMMPDFQADWAKLKTVVCTDTICTTCGDVTYTTILTRYYSQLTLAGLFFLIVFRQMHRSFLASTKDEASFQSTSAVSAGEKLSFRAKVFFEWIVSFGFFLAAGMIVLYGSMLRYTWMESRYPIPFLGITLFMFGGSFLLATLSTRFPLYRISINLGGGCLGILIVGYCFFTTWGDGWSNFARWDYLDSPQSWPLIFGVMLAGKTVFWGGLLLLLYGVWFLRCLISGKYSPVARRVFVAIFVIGTICIVSQSIYRHSETRHLYFVNLLFQLNRSISKDDIYVRKTFIIADMLIRESKSEYGSWVNAYSMRARLHIRQRNYDAAIADFRETIRIHSAEFDKYKHLYKNSTQNQLEICAGYSSYIGEAQLAKGNYADAVETLTSVLEISRSIRLDYGRTYKDLLYLRGYANEKLGDIEAAIKDYTEAIDAMEQSPAKRVETFVPREGYGKKYQPPYDIYGYEISLDELKTIRDGLLETKTATGQ